MQPAEGRCPKTNAGQMFEHNLAAASMPAQLSFLFDAFPKETERKAGAVDICMMRAGIGAPADKAMARTTR